MLHCALPGDEVIVLSVSRLEGILGLRIVSTVPVDFRDLDRSDNNISFVAGLG
jgi:hypothetical protein